MCHAPGSVTEEAGANDIVEQRKGFVMGKGMKHRVLAAILTTGCAAWAMEGMILQTIPDDPGARYTTGKLLVKYLSSGQTTELEGGGVFGACFSPDGNKIAFASSPGWWQRGSIVVMGIDGSNRTEIADILTEGGKEPSVEWATDGYIYWSDCTPKIRRVPENGGQSEMFHEALEKQNQGGVTMGREVHSLSMSLDGTRGIWTKNPPDIHNGWMNQWDWWSNVSCDFTTFTEYEVIGGCQSNISPDGSRLTRAWGTHDVTHVVPWELNEFAGDPNAQTYIGCSNYDHGVCPEYLYGIVYPAGYHSWMTRWSNTDEDVFMFTSEEGNESFVYSVKADQFEDVGVGCVWDYFAEEKTTPGPTASVSLSPSNLVINVEVGSTQMPAAKAVSVVNSGSGTLGVATVSGAPAWLTATVTGQGNDQQIVNTLNAAQLPAVGTYEATLTVTVQGASSSPTYRVTLAVSEPVQSAISIATPTAGQSVAVGDTLVVTYSAECDAIGSVVLFLSLSGNDDDPWVRMHLTSNEPCGDGKQFSFVIPATVLNERTLQQVSTVSATCRVKVQAYLTSDNAVSDQFAIVDAAAVKMAANGRLRSGPVSLHRSGTALSVVVEGRGGYVATLFDATGRAVAHGRGSASQPAQLDVAALARTACLLQIRQDDNTISTMRFILD